MGRAFSEEFDLDAGDPGATEGMIDKFADSARQAHYAERAPDRVLPSGEELHEAHEDDEDIVTHVVDGRRYVAMSTIGVPEARPHVVSIEGRLYSRVPLVDEFGEERPGRVDLSWDGHDWFRLDEARLAADGVRVLAGRLFDTRGREVTEADYELAG
jgi:hypothetical protein